MAAQFLSEETQRRAVAERKLKELEAEMVSLRDPGISLAFWDLTPR